MIKNERVEAAYQQLVEVVKEELANGCETEVSAADYITRVHINKKPDIAICRSCGFTVFLSCFDELNDEKINSIIEAAETEAKRKLIEAKEKELEELKKGLQA